MMQIDTGDIYLKYVQNYPAAIFVDTDLPLCVHGLYIMNITMQTVDG